MKGMNSLIHKIRALPGNDETKKRREAKINSLIQPLDRISSQLQTYLFSEQDVANNIVYKCQDCGAERPTEGHGSHSHTCLECEGHMTRDYAIKLAAG